MGIFPLFSVVHFPRKLSQSYEIIILSGITWIMICLLSWEGFASLWRWLDNQWQVFSPLANVYRFSVTIQVTLSIGTGGVIALQGLTWISSLEDFGWWNIFHQEGFSATFRHSFRTGPVIPFYLLNSIQESSWVGMGTRECSPQQATPGF